MKSTVESLSDLEKKLNIQISAQEVNTEFDKVFKYLQKNTESRGFRKGKTPIGVIRRLYGNKVKGDVTQSLVEKFYPKALKEHNLVPVASPNIDCQNTEENKEFSFTACFEVFPEIGEVQVDCLEVKKEKINIEDNLIDQSVERILDNQAEMEDVILIRELNQGDFADIDLFLYKDDRFLEQYSTEGYLLKIGSGSFIPGFEEGLIGMKPGEIKSLNLKFPDNYHEKSLQGEMINFKVVLNKIKKRVRPELNDKLVKKISKCQTVEEFKNDLKKNLIRSKEKSVERDLKDKLFKALVKANPFEVPESLLKRQRSTLVNRLKEQIKNEPAGNDDFSGVLKNQEKTLSEKAEFIVKCGLLIDKIVNENNLKATEEDLENHLRKFSEETSSDLVKLKKQFFNTSDMKNRLQSEVTEDKVFKFLLSKAKVILVDKKTVIEE